MSRRHRHLSQVFVAAAVATLSACAGDAEQLTNVLESSVSSAATVQMVAESWRGNRIPTAFARRTIREAYDDLFQASTAIQSLKVDDELRTRSHDATLGAMHASSDVLDALNRADTVRLNVSLLTVAQYRRALHVLLERANE